MASSCDNEVDKSYTIKLMKTRFSTNPDKMLQITMLPQLDIKFHFIFTFRLSEWVINEHHSSAVLVKQTKRRPTIRNMVRRDLMEFRYSDNLTRQAIGRVFARLFPDSADYEFEDMIEYAIVKAREIVKSKLTETKGNELDLYFNVLAQHHRFQIMPIDSTNMEI
ncbi:hypothetical protein CASFOL_027169 [Castilleja foliolosa]|uniref:Uncharacterized protein n=1 Tax=Castilleja foliolosa TaxID=1961234 RepID=A0ABD3CE21_9LAMI